MSGRLHYRSIKPLPSRGTCCTIILFSLSLAFFAPHVSAQSRLVDSLQRIVQLHRHDTTESKALNLLGSEFMRKDLRMAKTYFHQALQLATKLNYKLGITSVLAQIAISASKTGETDSAHYYIERLREFAEANPSVLNQSNYDFTAGLVYKNEGKFKEALPHMLKSLEAFVKQNSKVSQAGQLLNIGNTYYDMGDYKNAVDYHLRALKLFETLNNKRGESFTNQSIGNDFVALNQPKRGLPYLLKALEQKEALKDRRGIGAAWSGLGSLYKATGDNDKALLYYGKALGTAQEFHLTSEEALSNFELGIIYGHKTDLVKAEQYLKRARALAKQMGDSALTKAVDAEFLSVRTVIAKEENSEKDLLTSIHTSMEAGRRSTELSGYQHLIDYYEAHRQYDKAFSYQKKWQKAKDSLEGVEVQLQIRQLEEQFKGEKKEKEIALLRKDQLLSAVELKRQKTIQYAIIAFVCLLAAMAWLIVSRYLVLQKGKRLVEIERVRNSIARDLHDDIGSTLSSINIISKVALQTGLDASVSTQFHKIEDHSSRMMDKMSDIVWSINPINDTMDKILIRMKEFAAEILEPLNIQYQFNELGTLDGTTMSVQNRKNLFLIFKEAVNNAAKYSQCTVLTIDLEIKGNLFVLNVRDNGIGFDSNLERSGNGLTNMKARASMMGGTVSIHSTIGQGSSVHLSTVIT